MEAGQGATVAGRDWCTEGVEGREVEMKASFIHTEGIQRQK